MLSVQAQLCLRARGEVSSAVNGTFAGACLPQAPGPLGLFGSREALDGASKLNQLPNSKCS